MLRTIQSTLGPFSSGGELLEAVDFIRKILDRATFFPLTGRLYKACRSILADKWSSI